MTTRSDCRCPIDALRPWSASSRGEELDAEHWISRWEREAEASVRARDDHYWSDAWEWMAEQRRRGAKTEADLRG